MKNNKIKLICLFFASALLLSSCGKDDDMNQESIFEEVQPDNSELGSWISTNYTKPYNISATYAWNEAFGKQDKYLFPPKVGNVKPTLSVIKSMWLDSYSEVGGEDFVKKIAPRQLHLIGSYNLNHNNTIVLGDAGGGAKITLYNVDYLDYTDLNSVREFVHTMQHEYIHILNQTKPYDAVAWAANAAVLGGYTSAWYLESASESYKKGFFTSYARSSYEEDFAEAAAYVLEHTPEELDAFLRARGATEQRVLINKINLVDDYFVENFNMSLFDLQDAVNRNTQKVLNGDIDF